ncbi:MAG: zinc ribbon domain-containing protein [Pseudomonadota bacterium]
MPIYEFICSKCKNEFEELVFNSSEKVSCPKCGSIKVKKEMSVFSYSSGGKFSSSAGDSCGSCSKGSCSGCSH